MGQVCGTLPRMNTKTIGFVLVLGLAVGLWTYGNANNEAAESREQYRTQTVSERPVGAWFATTTITTPRVPIPLQRLITVHADGTFLSSDVDDFGSIGMDIQSDVNGPIHGAWARSGRRSFAFTGLFLVFDRTSGDPIAISKITANVAFPKQRRDWHASDDVLEGTFSHRRRERQDSGDVLEGTFSAVRFRLDQDPLDPNVEPIEGSFKEGLISLRRIRVELPHPPYHWK